MSSVGARTSSSRGPARSGRPPRETMAPTSCGRTAAETSAAAAPVLAPKYPMEKFRVSGNSTSHCVIATSRSARRADVEAKVSGLPVQRFFPTGEQVDEERPELRLVEQLGHVAVPRTVPAAAASV